MKTYVLYGRRQWSLRSTKDGIDVAEFAKVRGGGGHRHAAGYEDDAVLFIRGTSAERMAK